MPKRELTLTGGEWYDRFMAELYADTSILTPQFIKISSMAQKAAGLV